MADDKKIQAFKLENVFEGAVGFRYLQMHQFEEASVVITKHYEEDED